MSIALHDSAGSSGAVGSGCEVLVCLDRMKIRVLRVDYLVELWSSRCRVCRLIQPYAACHWGWLVSACGQIACRWQSAWRIICSRGQWRGYSSARALFLILVGLKF